MNLSSHFPQRLLPWLLCFGGVIHALALGRPAMVAITPGEGRFPLCTENAVADLLVDTNDFPGVIHAVNALRSDIGRVTGRTPRLLSQASTSGTPVLVAGTLGKSAFIDSLVKAGNLQVSAIAGKWESFSIQVVSNALPGAISALVICGSDKRGTIFGLYELCEQIGVSPWHYWADVPPTRHATLYIQPGNLVQGPPAVKYRGLFLNDEAPDLSNWILENYGTVPGHPGVANYGRGFYTNLFDLILRLKGNYLWPAMWNNAFNEDDPENPRLADEYGVVMGTSHQEPMLRAQKEWDRGPGRRYGNWNYNNTNQQPALQQFWREGIRRNKNYESIVTLGLRAENDSGQPIGKALTEEIVRAQRAILAEEVNPDLAAIPQLWCLYKEVQGFYEDGLRVPDDVTLLWAEDNWGDVRRLPSAAERGRRGGAGVYYHFDYHGGPRSYQWLNTSPIPKIRDQLALAKQYGADRIWIVNVGHFKGCEFPLEFFMHLAWDTDRWTNEHLDEFTRLWAEREFGSEQAAGIAELMTGYTRFNGRRKPELLEPGTYSLLNYREAETVVADYEALRLKAERIHTQLPPERRDAFYELVLFPVKACAQLHALYLAAARNALYASQGRASANAFAAETRRLFAAQTNLMNDFNHTFAGGKWNHFMDQTHLGYTSWNDPPQNSLRAVRLTEVEVKEAAGMGLALEGSSSAWPGPTHPPALPPFDSFNRQRRWIDVFNHGTTPFDFTAVASVPWIGLSKTSARVDQEGRIWVSIDWSQAPQGAGAGSITFTGAGQQVVVEVSAFNPSEPALESLHGFIEGEGYVAMEAEHYTRNTPAGRNRWLRIPDYGHTLSAMRADGPADTLATPGKDSPCLEYRMYLFHGGRAQVEVTAGPTLNFLPGRPLRYAVSFDDQPPQTVTLVSADFVAQNGNRDWEESVKNNCRRARSSHEVGNAGYHTLRLWMVEPAVAVERIVVDAGGVRPSYLGPPESFRRE